MTDLSIFSSYLKKKQKTQNSSESVCRKTNRHLFKNKNNNFFKVEEEYAAHFLILPSKKMC